MVCCLLPCMASCKVEGETSIYLLIVTELIQWIVVIGSISMALWRYGEITEYQGTTQEEFWIIAGGSLAAVSIVLYLPLKVLAIWLRTKRNKLKDYRWRPPILFYIVICALPSLSLILTAIIKMRGSPSHIVLDANTVVALQVLIFGLTITEWMTKLREEIITYDLMTAMAVDFFFAYEVIGFIMMTIDPNIFQSNWVYICFAFTFISMFKYVPAHPVTLYEHGAPRGATISILVNMCSNDIPFFIIRLTTMIQFGLVVSQLIYPLKNVAVVIFSLTQLYIIYYNKNNLKERKCKQDGRWNSTETEIRAVTPNDGGGNADGVMKETVMTMDNTGPSDVENGLTTVVTIDVNDSSKSENPANGSNNGYDFAQDLNSI